MIVTRIVLSRGFLNVIVMKDILAVLITIVRRAVGVFAVILCGASLQLLAMTFLVLFVTLRLMPLRLIWAASTP
jgi:hypothetical protein